MPGMMTTGKPVPLVIIDASVSQCLACLQRIGHSFQCPALAAETEKALAFEIEESLLAEGRAMRNVTARKHARHFGADDPLMIRNPAGTVREVDSERERREHIRPAHGYRGS